MPLLASLRTLLHLNDKFATVHEKTSSIKIGFRHDAQFTQKKQKRYRAFLVRLITLNVLVQLLRGSASPFRPTDTVKSVLKHFLANEIWRKYTLDEIREARR